MDVCGDVAKAWAKARQGQCRSDTETCVTTRRPHAVRRCCVVERIVSAAVTSRARAPCRAWCAGEARASPAWQLPEGTKHKDKGDECGCVSGCVSVRVPVRVRGVTMTRDVDAGCVVMVLMLAFPRYRHGGESKRLMDEAYRFKKLPLIPHIPRSHDVCQMSDV